MIKFKKQLAKKAGSLSNNSLLMILMTATTLVISLSVVMSRVWYADVRFTNKVISRKAEVNKTLENNVSVLPQLQDNFKFLQQNGPLPSEVVKALPTTADYPGFASEVEAMAALSGSQLLAITPETTVTPGPGGVAPVSVTFRLSAVGTYRNLRHFIKNLQAAKRPVTINSFTVTGTEPAVSLDLALTTYYQPATIVGDDMETINDEN